ncbi:MAG: prepilin-type N-terminal cleavage/methylation domain-containing protein [Zoogloeaceae bacterium]|jgi:prepilin-type N-terminal cleavage/methylation domain-containing protein|nr:prepilin-type N-terminal cleavage/methylation domain-containing protein [Zoogloeaceae bacterium]
MNARGVFLFGVSRPGSTRPTPERGFTMTELVIVMILISILAGAAIPRFMQGTEMYAQHAFRDDVTTALRYAQKSAVSHRRLVCAALNTENVMLTIANAHPSVTCNLPLQGIKGKQGADALSGHPSARITTTGTLYFQPDGSITANSAGTAYWNTNIAVSGTDAIEVVGETGYVR